MNHKFLVMWCNEGLECVIDLTEDEKNRTWSVLTGKPPVSRLPSLHHLILRAKFNMQRAYEIYTVEATEGITADDIRDMFENSPQTAADTIRERGNCLHSDRVTDDRVLIR